LLTHPALRILVLVILVGGIVGIGLVRASVPFDGIVAGLAIYAMVAVALIIVATLAQDMFKAGTFSASGNRLLAWLPTLAAIGTLAAFFALWNQTFQVGPWVIGPRWVIPLGLSVAVATWLVLATLAKKAAADTGTSEAAVAEIATRTRTLRARLNELQGNPPEKTAAAAEAEAHLAYVEEYLRDRTGRPTQVGSHLGARVALHRAEEALLELTPPAALEGEILHDELRLGTAHLGADAEMLRSRLAEARKDLPLTTYSPLNADEKVQLQLAQAVAREARHAMNDFREARWDGLLRAQERLTRSTIMTSWTIYLLLALAIALGANNRAIGAAAVLFTVGAAVGLFARLRADARVDTAVYDYGLSAAQLRQTVVASGLAGVAGVVLTGIAVSAGLTAGQTVPAGGQIPTAQTLGNIFDISVPGGLLIAAIFGLTPNLLLERLRSKTDEYRRDLEETAPVSGSPEGASSTSSGTASSGTGRGHGAETSVTSPPIRNVRGLRGLARRRASAMFRIAVRR
jgi:hypothetical protein